MDFVQSMRDVDLIYSAILRMYADKKQRADAMKAARGLLQQVLDGDDGEHLIAIVTAMQAQNLAAIIVAEGKGGELESELRARLKAAKTRKPPRKRSTSRRP